jgi:PST family polysaccharide transporter
MLSGRLAIHSIANNTGWLMIDKVLRVVLGLLVTAWIARYLGPEEFGILAYVIAYITFFQAFANLGLDTSVVRDIARDQKIASSILGTTIALRFCSSILAIFASVLIIGIAYGWNSQMLWITVLVSSSLVFQIGDTVDLWFQSQSQNFRTITIKVLVYVTSNGLKFAGVLFNAPLEYFAALITLESALSGLGMFISYKKFPVVGVWTATYKMAKFLLHQSWPFLLSGISVMIYMRFDQLLIKYFMSSSDLGIYAAAIPIASVWSAFPMAVCASIAPYLARARLNEPAKYLHGLRLIFKYFFMMSLTLSIVISFFSDQIIKILYGDAYAESAKVLSIYVYTNVPIFLGVAQGLWITNEGRSIVILKNTILGGICAIVSNFILIPEYGLTGAAISAVIAYAASAILGNIIFCKELFYLQIGIKCK